jgi:hypothetical protein
VLLNDLPREALQQLRETAAGADVPIFVGVTPLGGALGAGATHLIKLISPQLNVQQQHAEVFDVVRPFVVGRSRNFVYAVG